MNKFVTTFQKHAPTISILLLVALLVTLLFFPASSRILSIALTVFGIGTAIVFTVKSNWKTFRKAQDRLTRAEFVRNTILDLLGLALTMGAAMWLGRMAGGYAGQAVGSSAGLGWGIAAGIAAGMVVGFGAAFVVQKVWGKVAEPMKASVA